MNKIYKCTQCNCEFDSLSLYANHIRHHHLDKKLIECQYCHKHIITSSFIQHERSCIKNPNSKKFKDREDREKKLKDKELSQICEFCGKFCKNQNSYKQHVIRCKSNPNKIDTSLNEKALEKAHNARRGVPSWNKGLSAKTNETIAETTQKIKEGYSSGRLKGSFCNRKHTINTKEKMRTNAIDKNFSSHFGHHKTYQYNGIRLHSSYELQLVQDLDKHNVEWNIPKYGTFTYKSPDGQTHKYTPDIFLPKYNIYLDPKNDFLINNINPVMGFCDCDKIKWVMEQNPGVKIIVLNKHQLSWEFIKSII